MATARSIASLSLSFGLVSIPVRLYSATESSATIRFNMLAPDGSRVEQQYVSKSTGKILLIPLRDEQKACRYCRAHVHAKMQARLLF